MAHPRRILLLVALTTVLLPIPISAAERPTTRFDYRDTTLKNGLRVVTMEDFSCPIVAVQVWYHVGSKNERPDRQGFAHMFEHMMFRGTDRLGPTDHFELIRRVGGTANGYTTFDLTVYLETLPADQLDLALWLEAERMSFLKIDQKSFDTERKVVEEERRMGKNRPYGTLLAEILARLYKVHPYRWSPIGNIAHLRASSVGELRDWWRRYYVPNSATLLIVGAVRHKESLEKARKYFGWIPRCPDPPTVTVREPQPTQARSVVLKQKNAPAPLAGIIFRTAAVSHEDTFALELLAHILGKGRSSRIYRDLVAERQLAVEAYVMQHSLEQDGMLAFGAVMSPLRSEPKKVLERIEAIVERARSEKPTQREFLKARNQVLRGLVTRNLRVGNKAGLLGSAAVLEGDVARVNGVLDRLRKVTPDDLHRVAKTYLAPQRAMRFTVPRNLAGGLAGKVGKPLGKKDPEEDAPITAKPEKVAPRPGRKGARRPKDYPTKPPLAKIAAAEVSPEFSTHRFPSGLKVIVVPNHELPFASVDLRLRIGAVAEGKPGSAVMAMALLTKGTRRRSEAELADEMETHAIGLAGSADMDSANIDTSCLTEYLPKAMDMLAEVVLQPTFPRDEFEKLRKQWRTGLAVSTARPSYKAQRELSRRLYGKHPYARTTEGEMADVDRLTVADCRRWYGRFVRPDLAVLVFAGDVDHATAVGLARKAFGKWRAPGERPRLKLPDPPRPAETHIYLIDDPGSTQSQIRIGQLTIGRGDPRYFTSRVVGGYFGHSFGGRLSKRIRVEKGLTYGVWGGHSAGKHAGRFTVGTFSKTASTAQAVGALLEEIQRLRREPPSQDELTKTRCSILGSYARQHETPQSVANDLWYLEHNHLQDDHLDRMLQHVAKTTAEDCLSLAADTVDPKRLVIVVVGDAKRVRKDLAKIAPVTVITEEARKKGKTSPARQGRRPADKR